MWKLPLNEQPIDAIVVQAVTEGLQLVVVDDAHERMQFWCFDESGIVVWTVNSKNSFHSKGKDT